LEIKNIQDTKVAYKEAVDSLKKMEDRKIKQIMREPKSRGRQ